MGPEAWTAQRDFAWASPFNSKQRRANDHGEGDAETQALRCLSIRGWARAVKAEAAEESRDAGPLSPVTLRRLLQARACNPSVSLALYISGGVCFLSQSVLGASALAQL